MQSKETDKIKKNRNEEIEKVSISDWKFLNFAIDQKLIVFLFIGFSLASIFEFYLEICLFQYSYYPYDYKKIE